MLTVRTWGRGRAYRLCTCDCAPWRATRTIGCPHQSGLLVLCVSKIAMNLNLFDAFPIEFPSRD